jgi:hypothetical protein
MKNYAGAYGSATYGMEVMVRGLGYVYGLLDEALECLPTGWDSGDLDTEQHEAAGQLYTAARRGKYMAAACADAIGTMERAATTRQDELVLELTGHLRNVLADAEMRGRKEGHHEVAPVR